MGWPFEFPMARILEETLPQAQPLAFLDAEIAPKTTRASRSGVAKKSTRKATKTYTVVVELLDEEVYLATSDDIDGLVLETDTLEEMIEEMRENIPWLLKGNHSTRVAKRDLSIDQKGKSTGRKVTYTVSHPV